MSEAPGTHNPKVLPPDLPVPQDDGAARHLAGHEAAGHRAAGDRRRAASTCRSSRAAPSSMSIRAPACRASMLPTGLGRDPGRARLHAAILRLPRSFRRAQAARRGAALRAVDAGHRLPAARRRSGCICRLRSCRMRHLTLTQALKLPTFTIAGMTLLKRMALGDRRRRDHQGVLSGVPARQERRRGGRLASGVEIAPNVGKHRAEHLRRERVAGGSRRGRRGRGASGRARRARGDRDRRAHLIPFSVADGRPIDVATLQVDVRQAASASSVNEDEGVARLHIALHARLALTRPTWPCGARDHSIRERPTTRRIVADVRRGDRGGRRPDARRRGPGRPRRHGAHERRPVRRPGGHRRPLRQGASRAVRRVRPVAARALVALRDPADPGRPDAGGGGAHRVHVRTAAVRDAHLLREQLPGAHARVRPRGRDVPGGAGEQRVVRHDRGLRATTPDEPHARDRGRTLGRERRRLGDQRVHRSHRSGRLGGRPVPAGDPPPHHPFLGCHDGLRATGGLAPVALARRRRRHAPGAPPAFRRPAGAGAAVARSASHARHPSHLRGTGHDRMGARAPHRAAGTRGRPRRRRLLTGRHGQARARRRGGRTPGPAARASAEVRPRRAPTSTGSGWASPTGTTCWSRWTPTCRTSPRSSRASWRRPSPATT